MSTVYQGHQSSSRLFVGLVAVVAFHLIAIIAFKSGLIRNIVIPDPVPPITIVDIPVEEQPPPPPPPVVQLRPEIQEPVITYIAPEIPIDIPPIESPVTVVETAPATRESTAATPTGEGPQVVDFQVDSRYPLSRPYYPPPDIRLNHEGLVTLMIYVMPNGRVGEAKIAVTSGYRGLDDSAIREAIKSWRFKPRMEGGRAVGSWGTFRVRFKLDR